MEDLPYSAGMLIPKKLLSYWETRGKLGQTFTRVIVTRILHTVRKSNDEGVFSNPKILSLYYTVYHPEQNLCVGV